MKKFYLIAGESSGDNIGAGLIKSLKKSIPDAEFYGIGGEKMKNEGMKIIFPSSEIALMGFIEIIPHIFSLLNKINRTIEDIKNIDPDVIITIDAPGFCFRVIKKIKEKVRAKLIHYVAPTVWAYKPERAKQIAALFDHLLVILPFEPPYFLKEGLDTSFVGYPAIENFKTFSRNEFRQKYDLKEDDILVSVTPGSRKQEVKTLLPIFLGALKKIGKKEFKIAVLVQAHLKELVTNLCKENNNIIIVDESDKELLFSSVDIALTKSGTITTELGFFKIPMVVAHKVNWLSYWIIKKMIKVKFVSIINILAQKEIIPELLQENCNIDKIAKELVTVMENKYYQVDDINKAIGMLTLYNEKPSDLAAQKIISLSQD